MQLSNFIIGAVLGLASTSLALPADLLSVPATDKSLATREPGPDSSSGTVTTITASAADLPSTVTTGMLNVFPGVIGVAGTAVAPLNNGPAAFSFLTSSSNELTGTTITQTVNDAQYSLDILFGTPLHWGLS